MKNLFIMHTQYNIISAVAVLKKDYQEEQNDLIVVSEFPIAEEYVNKLRRLFRHVWVAQFGFDSTQGVQKLRALLAKYKRCSEPRKERYDRVITAQEQYLDTLLVSQLKSNNPRLEWQSVEEDAYYSLGTVKPRTPYIRHLVKTGYYHVLLPLIFGKNFLYEELPCYGANSHIDKIYLTYPQFARPEIKCTRRIELNAPEIQQAVKTIYGTTNICLEKNSVLFFSDLSDRYRNRRAIETLVTSLAVLSEQQGRRFYIKYHPREKSKITGVSADGELPASLPAELLLAGNIGKNITIIGNQSTAVFLAKKMGYQTFSFARMENPDDIDESVRFYEKIGIKCITNFNEVKESLR